MPNGRAKKGGEIGINGEFYKGGVFLPSTTTRSKNICNKMPQRKTKKPLQQWQIDNINRAIEGTKKTIEMSKLEGNQLAVDANEAYLESLLKQLLDQPE